MIAETLRRPVTVIVATLLLSALGAFSLANLPVSLLPEVERPRIVVTAHANAARDEMVHEVTEPLEQRLALAPGVSSIESRTSDGEARIELQSAWQADPDRLRIDVARRIEGASRLPLRELEVETSGAESTPVVDVAVSGANGATRTVFAQRVLLPELARVDGAGKIEIVGSSPLRLTVRPRAADLSARGLTAADVVRRLESVGRPIAAGRAREGGAVRPLIVVERVRTAADLGALRIPLGAAATSGGVPAGVPLGEVADVAIREVPDESVFLASGRRAGEPADAVLLRVYRAPNANAVALARAVRERVRELGGRAGDLRLAIAGDRSREVSRALFELALSALLGIALGTLVLRFALGAWRPTLALVVVVPVALLVSFGVFYFAGVSLDVISLAGLALATGLLVDNSIVVLEAIETARGAGERAAVLAGTRRIAIAVVASSLTLMIVFAPLLYLRGLARALFGEEALAVVASVGASLLLSLTLTPVLAAKSRMTAVPHPLGREPYLRLVDAAFHRPKRLVLAAAAFAAIGLALVPLLPRQLFARGEARHVIADLRLPAAADGRAARAMALAVWRNAAAALPQDAVASMTLIAAGEVPARIDVELRSGARAGTVVEALRRMSPVPGVSSRVRLRPSALIEGVAGDAGRLEVVVSAIDARAADELARRVSSAMTRAGFGSAEESARLANAFGVRWDDARLAQNGIDRTAAEEQLGAALGGVDAGTCDIRGVENAIRVLPTVPASLSNAPLRVGGRIVPLAAVAAVTIAQRSESVTHDQGRPSRRLSFDLDKRESRTQSAFGGAAAAAEEAMHAVEVGRGERIRVAGHVAEMREAFAQMAIAFALATLLLYLTVAAFYESMLLPLLVMTAVPFAGAGAITALLLTGQSLNVMSLIGLILLGGIVVNHTVVLVDRAEQLRRGGTDDRAAIRTAAAERYRPVVMTTATALLAMLPLAVIGGDGVELRRAIAIAVSGGLLTATAGTLVIVPLLYAMIAPLRRRRAAEVESRQLAEAVHA